MNRASLVTLLAVFVPFYTGVNSKYGDGNNLAKVSTVVKERLKTNRATDVMLDFWEDACSSITQGDTMRSLSHKARSEYVKMRLEDKIKNSHANVSKILYSYKRSKPGLHIQTFRITNRIYIKGAEMDLVMDLAACPEVREVREARTHIIKTPVFRKRTVRSVPTGIQWGVEKVGANKAWAAGYSGESVKVGVIDTGVNADHEAIRDQMDPIYGWFDPQGLRSKPEDQNGHGTHVIGVICGKGGVGVAPNATFMAAIGCPDGTCQEHDVILSMDFLFCPYKPGFYDNCDINAGAHVIHCSWGALGGNDTYGEPARALSAAGILVVAAAGNEGPDCSTIDAPAENPLVLAVGAMDTDMSIAPFSSRGPAPNKVIKPDLCAPGVDILSSYNTGNNSYVILSGTSMAAPHVTGVCALMISRNLSLVGDSEKLKQLIIASATAEGLTFTGTCGSSNDTIPNCNFGYGMVQYLPIS